MANFRAALEAGLFSTLNVQSLLTVATGGVYNSLAPQGTKPPFVVFSIPSKLDDYHFAARGVNALALVKAVSRSTWPAEAEDIDTVIDTLMQDAALTVAGYSVWYCRRESDFAMPEDDKGELWQHVGGLYRIRADQS